MAIFPQGLTNVDQRCNPGERRVLHQLKRCLEDDYLVWHNVPVGPRARQPDFVILSPRQGILLLEVKDWRRSTLASANRDKVELLTPRGRVTEANPLRQARDYALELVELMQRDPTLVHAQGAFSGKLLFPYGWGVVFSRITQDEVAGSDFGEVFAAPGADARRSCRDDGRGRVPEAAVGLVHRGLPAHADAACWTASLAPVPELQVQQQGALDFGKDADAAPALPDCCR